MQLNATLLTDNSVHFSLTDMAAPKAKMLSNEILDRDFNNLAKPTGKLTDHFKLTQSPFSFKILGTDKKTVVYSTEGKLGI